MASQTLERAIRIAAPVVEYLRKTGWSPASPPPVERADAYCEEVADIEVAFLAKTISQFEKIKRETQDWLASKEIATASPDTIREAKRNIVVLRSALKKLRSLAGLRNASPGLAFDAPYVRGRDPL